MRSHRLGLFGLCGEWKSETKEKIKEDYYYYLGKCGKENNILSFCLLFHLGILYKFLLFSPPLPSSFFFFFFLFFFFFYLLLVLQCVLFRLVRADYDMNPTTDHFHVPERTITRSNTKKIQESNQEDNGVAVVLFQTLL